MSKDIGERIREIRGQRTQAEFGRLIGRSQNAVKNYEQGTPPREEVLLKIAAQDPHNRGERWLRYGAAAEGRVAEAVTPYGKLDRRHRAMRDMLDELLQTDDDEILDHLKRQLSLLNKLAKTRR